MLLTNVSSVEPFLVTRVDAVPAVDFVVEQQKLRLIPSLRHKFPRNLKRRSNMVDLSGTNHNYSWLATSNQQGSKFWEELRDFVTRISNPRWLEEGNHEYLGGESIGHNDQSINLV